MAGEIAGAVMFVTRIAIALAAVDAWFHDGFLLKHISRRSPLTKKWRAAQMPLSRGRGAGGRPCQSEAALKGLARRAREADATENSGARGSIP
jgi:hypothetical protein